MSGKEGHSLMEGKGVISGTGCVHQPLPVPLEKTGIVEQCGFRMLRCFAWSICKEKAAKVVDAKI
jgi:hypothetical protein